RQNRDLPPQQLPRQPSSKSVPRILTIAVCRYFTLHNNCLGDFDLLITDLDLPGGTGLDLVRQAKALCPSILVTAYGCSEVRRQAQELEVAGYFEKPYDPGALMTLVRSSIGNSETLSARSTRSG
ncbi:MAG: response regulator, partial [Vicinamibacteria bacterium]